MVQTMLGLAVLVGGVYADGPPGVVVSVEFPTGNVTYQMREPVEIEKLPPATGAPPEQEYEQEEGAIPSKKGGPVLVEEEPEDPPTEPMCGSWHPAILE